ncbi:ubiquitin-conjugating enzyme/RWD-like protein [Phyllosticta citricarpa]|uniref:Ubiquitin-conjugating enzyme/RWD-like protein n=3 Tax=Phyllosticta TaxID=121621 RepID=A0ABR1LE81_9PEZI
MSSARRLQSRMKRLYDESQADLTDTDALECLGPLDDSDLTHWRAVMKGSPGTPYENGRWLLDIQASQDYPFSPPHVIFNTRICHPNVKFETGKICLDILDRNDAWSPAFTISTTLTCVHQLLSNPVWDSPLNMDLAVLHKNDKLGAESVVRYYCDTERWEGEGFR